MAESLHVQHVMALQTTTILYTRHPQHYEDVLVKAMPAQPLEDDRGAAAQTSVSLAPTQLPFSVTAPTADPQPATPNPKKRAASTGGRQGGAKRAKAGVRSQ